MNCICQCIGVSDVAGFYGVGVDSPLDQRAMLELAPAVLYINTQHRCSGNVLNNDTMPTSSSQLASKIVHSICPLSVLRNAFMCVY